jgi:hypothetical protein
MSFEEAIRDENADVDTGFFDEVIAADAKRADYLRGLDYEAKLRDTNPPGLTTEAAGGHAGRAGQPGGGGRGGDGADCGFYGQMGGDPGGWGHWGANGRAGRTKVPIVKLGA